MVSILRALQCAHEQAWSTATSSRHIFITESARSRCSTSASPSAAAVGGRPGREVAAAIRMPSPLELATGTTTA